MITLADIMLENFDPPWFWAGLALIAMGVLTWTYLGMYRRSGRPLVVGLLALRALGAAALIVALIKPAWTRVEERLEKPRLAVVLDDSQSMWLSAGNGESTSRYELAKRLIGDSDFASGLRQRFTVSLFNINGESLDATRLPAEPSAEQTDLVRALRAASTGRRGRSSAGVLLISDGRDTTGRESFMSVQDLPTAVYAVGYRSAETSSGTPFDLAVAGVDAPPRTMVHNTVRIRIAVSKDGGAALDVPVQVELAGALITTERVSLPQDSSQRVAELSFTPEEAGDFMFTARVPEQPGERTGRNNAVSFRLRVEAEPIRVLYIEGYLRPEYTFLRDRLGNDPDVDLVTLVRFASPDELNAGASLAGADLLTQERLKRFDVILLGDFEASLLDDSAYEAIERWVSAGGGLLILGGYQNLAPRGLVATPLGRVLPVEPATGATTQVNEPFLFELTPEGRAHPALYLTGDVSRDNEAWKTLPHLTGITAVGGVKPGAVVLARHPLPSPYDPERRGHPVLVTQRFGEGVVTLLTADTTWRWSRYPRLGGQPDTLYVRFWSQMVRWLAGRDVLSLKPALQATTDAASYERGKRVNIEVRRNVAAMIPGTEALAATPSLIVRGPDGRNTPVPLSATSDPDMWSASYFPDRGGRFTLAAKLTTTTEFYDEPTRDLTSDTTAFLVQGSPLELDDPSANPASLQQIATYTGGAFAMIDDQTALRQMLNTLPDERWSTFETRRAVVWNNPALFVLFVVCVCTEWIIRRKNQLI